MTSKERETAQLLRQSAKLKLDELYTLTDEQINAILDPKHELEKALAFVEYSKELRRRYPNDSEVTGIRGAAGLMAKTKNFFGLLE